MTNVKVTITTMDGEVLEHFVVQARPYGDSDNRISLARLVRDKISDRFNTADTLAEFTADEDQQ